MEWENIFANHMPDKLLIKVCKELTTQCQKTNNKEKKIPNNQIKIRLRAWIDIFLKEDIQIANKYIKRCSTSLIIRKVNIKNDEIMKPLSQRDVYPCSVQYYSQSPRFGKILCRMDEWTKKMVKIYNGLLYKEGNHAFCNNVGEPGRHHYAKQISQTETNTAWYSW